MVVFALWATAARIVVWRVGKSGLGPCAESRSRET